MNDKFKLEEIEKYIKETKARFNKCEYDEIKYIEGYLIWLNSQKDKIKNKLSAGRH